MRAASCERRRGNPRHGWLLAGEGLSIVALLGAALTLVAIASMELLPRMRPPLPLPEG